MPAAWNDLFVDTLGPDPMVVRTAGCLFVDVPEDPLQLLFVGVGMPGRDGADGAGILEVIAGEPIGGHRIVAIAADDLARLADPASAAADLPTGMTLGAAAAGEPVTIQSAGYVTEPGWSWVPGAVFLGADGIPTQALPTSGAIFQIGVSAGPTRIRLTPLLIAQLT